MNMVYSLPVGQRGHHTGRLNLPYSQTDT